MKQADLIIKDFMITNEEFRLIKDEKYRGLLRTSPTPPLNELAKYYDSSAYISHSDNSKGIINTLYYWVKNYNLNKKYSLLKKEASGNKILDYGCGTGEFVNFLNQKNLNAFGFEPNKNAFEIASKKLSDKYFQTSEILETEKFDIITLWHVLEHVPNLFEEIERLKNGLNKNGKLFVAVPNYESYDAEYYKEFWAAYDTPRHLWHFSQNAIHQIFNDFGMIVEKIYPMWFDAFYVSMLSEKYKKRNIGFLRAIALGSVSNLKAIQNGQFSSLIYQIKIK